MKFWQNKGKMALLQNKEPKIFFDEWLKVMFTKTLIGFKNILKWIDFLLQSFL